MSPLLCSMVQHLAEAVNAHREHQEIDSVKEAGQVEEDQPRLAADDIEPDRRQREPDEDGEEGLRYVVAAETDEGGERRAAARPQLKTTTRAGPLRLTTFTATSHWWRRSSTSTREAPSDRPRIDTSSRKSGRRGELKMISSA